MSDIDKEYEPVNKDIQDKCLDILTDELSKNKFYKRPQCSRSGKERIDELEHLKESSKALKVKTMFDERAHLKELELIELDYINYG